MSVEDSIKISYSKEGHIFEILVKPTEALQFKEKKITDFSKVLFVQEIFRSVSSAEKAAEHDLQKLYKKMNVVEIAEDIFKHGKMELTTEQRRHLVEEKRKQIVYLIARRAKDPRTNAPHPPQRIETAMNEVRLNIDPLKPAEEQLKGVIDKLKVKIPLSFENKSLLIKIPNTHAGKCYDIIRHLAEVKQEQWTSSFLFIKIEFPAGLQNEILDKLNTLTSGDIEIKEMKRV